MYRIIAKQHKDYITPFSNGYPIFTTNGDWVYLKIAEAKDKNLARQELGKILKTKFDADYDESNKSYYINEEKVFDLNSTECIFNGINIWIENEKVKWTNNWESIEFPLDSNIDIQINEKAYGFDIKVDGEYLICLNTISYMRSNLIGRKAFWLDPCALHGDVHTSDWREIADIDIDVITFVDGTEAYTNECYI